MHNNIRRQPPSVGSVGVGGRGAIGVGGRRRRRLGRRLRFNSRYARVDVCLLGSCVRAVEPGYFRLPKFEAREQNRSRTYKSNGQMFRAKRGTTP